MGKNIREEWGIKNHPVESFCDGPKRTLLGRIHISLLPIK